jgi:Protein of unknown function (DUF3558)
MRCKALTAAGLAAVFAAAGCGSETKPKPNTAAEPNANPVPTTVKAADPCSLLEPSVVSTFGLKDKLVDKSPTSRSCSWKTDAFATMVLARWDDGALADFMQAFPVPVGRDIKIAGLPVVMGRSDVRPACALALFAEKGTVVETVVGYNPPAKVATACARVKLIGASVIRQLRIQHLLHT